MSLHGVLDTVTIGSTNPVLLQSKGGEESSCLSHWAFLGKLGTWAQKLLHVDIFQVKSLSCVATCPQLNWKLLHCCTNITSHCSHRVTHLPLLGTPRPGRLQLCQVEESSQSSQLTCKKTIKHDPCANDLNSWFIFTEFLQTSLASGTAQSLGGTLSGHVKKRGNSGVIQMFFGILGLEDSPASWPSRCTVHLCQQLLGRKRLYAYRTSRHTAFLLLICFKVSKLKGDTWQEGY